MRSNSRLSSALALAFLWATPAITFAKGKAPSSDGSKKIGKEISADDPMDKQMDWEAKVMGPNTQKKIDLAKIQKLQAEEMARREKQEKVDQAEKERKEREAAAAAAAQRNVKGPSMHEVPSVPEPPTPAKPVEKHDDAFVDKLLTGKGERKKVAVSNDEVDELLTKAKQEKATSGKTRGKGSDNVDQLLATADKQAPIKTTTVRPADPTIETVSAEAAAREATLKALAAMRAQEERARKQRPVIPDAAVLRAQTAAAQSSSSPGGSKPASARSAAWNDPFASDSPASVSARGRGKHATTPTTSTRAPAAGRHSPSSRPAGGNDGWQDPFDSGGSTSPKARPAPAKAAPASRPGKHRGNWKDPFA